MPEYTPGPWEVGKSVCGYYPAVVKRFRANHNMQICGTVHGYMYAEKLFGVSEEENQRANANLIAAAPELYYALEEAVTEFWNILEAWDYPDPDTIERIIIRAEKALAKAEGRRG